MSQTQLKVLLGLQGLFWGQNGLNYYPFASICESSLLICSQATLNKASHPSLQNLNDIPGNSFQLLPCRPLGDRGWGPFLADITGGGSFLPSRVLHDRALQDQLGH